MQGPNPAIAGEAIRKAVGPDGSAQPTGQVTSERQTALDQAELRDLERKEYARLTVAAIDPLPAPGPRRRSLLDRLLRR